MAALTGLSRREAVGFSALAVLAAVALVLAAVAVIGRGSGVAAGTPTTYPTVAPSIVRPTAVFLGGSFTTGAGASSPSTSWPSVISTNRGWREVNVATTGPTIFSTTKNCGTQCPDVPTFVAGAVKESPDIVVVGSQVDDKADLPSVEVALIAALKALRAALPEAYIVVVGPAQLPAVPTDRLLVLDRAVQIAASAANATYAGLLSPSPLASDATLTTDRSAPNDAGQAAIAVRIAKALS